MFENFKAGYVAIIGKPNAGKSTLLNQLLKFKLSIVTRKPQTTRKSVLGILSDEESQIIFIDTPGIIEPRYDLQKVMMSYVKTALEDADVVVYIVDVSQPDFSVSGAAEKLPKTDKPVILLLNKIDLVARDKILPWMEQAKNLKKFSAIIPLSALNGDNVDELVKEIRHLLPYNPPYYPPDYVTDQQERFFVSEIIREKIFELYSDEIPYSCHVQIEEFKERPGRKDYIQAIIYVEKLSQKGILIGKKGTALKRVGELARADIEAFLERPVYLELYVKVMDKWRRQEHKLRRLGY